MNFVADAIVFSDSITIKVTFSESSHHYLSNDISFVWFRGSPNFAIVFGNDVTVMSQVRFMKNILCILVGLK